MACPDNVETMATKSIEAELELERSNMLKRYLSRPLYISRATGRLRVSIEESATITTNVTSLNQIEGMTAKEAFVHRQQRSNWALNVRSRIA